MGHAGMAGAALGKAMLIPKAKPTGKCLAAQQVLNGQGGGMQLAQKATHSPYSEKTPTSLE